MKAVTKLVFLDEQNERFFGEGPYKLFRSVEETGSLRAAALSMGMAYTKALRILKNAENALGFALTERSIGGKNGGGSSLTAQGKAWLVKYEAYRAACEASNQALYRQFFPKAGCIIMASGLGKRFGGNKLMADFNGKPLIYRVLESTKDVFTKRIVVTRHADVAELCRGIGVEAVLHDAPFRSDAVRIGMDALKEMDGCMFCLGDQPLLTRDTVAALLRSWEGEQDMIWRTECGGEPASPVLFPKWAFEMLRTLPQGEGGAYVLKQHPDRVRTLTVADACELMDVDTPQDLEFLQKRYQEEKSSYD